MIADKKFKKVFGDGVLDPLNLRFSLESDGRVVGEVAGAVVGEGPPLDADVGELRKFRYETLQSCILQLNERPLVSPPPALAGNSTGGKGKHNLEELLIEAVKRLERQGSATMVRYPVASVLLKGSSRPMQIPSLPDFEGVTAGGSQFVWEAKVCTKASFPVSEVFIKRRQVRHMLTRSDFGVPCHLILHFNERVGKAYYDPAFTVAVPVKRECMGGWSVWEKFAASKDKNKKKEFQRITREMASAMGIPVRWEVPPRCRVAYPVVGPVLLGDEDPMVPAYASLL